MRLLVDPANAQPLSSLSPASDSPADPAPDSAPLSPSPPAESESKLDGKREAKAFSVETDPAPGKNFVCDDGDCASKASLACARAHRECGHMCGGVLGEDTCPPCLREGCVERYNEYLEGQGGRALTQNAEDFCNICFTEDLGSAPSILLGCGHAFHYVCAVDKLKSKSAFLHFRITLHSLTYTLAHNTHAHVLTLTLTRLHYTHTDRLCLSLAGGRARPLPLPFRSALSVPYPCSTPSSTPSRGPSHN